MGRLGREHLGGMSDEGKDVTARRERLGLKKTELAAEAGVSRNTLFAIEEGKSFNRATLARIERALAQLEEEAGFDAPPVTSDMTEQDLVEFRIEGVMGVEAVVVKGPVKDVEKFETSIARILRQVQSGTETPESD